MFKVNLGMEVHIHTARSRRMSVVSHFTAREEAHGSQLTEGWVDHTASQDTLEKRKVSCPCSKLNPLFLSHTANSLINMQMSYPNFMILKV
jgi:hypothetical protein